MSSTRSRCRSAIRSARCRTCWQRRISATSPAAFTLAFTRIRSRISAVGSTAKQRADASCSPDDRTPESPISPLSLSIDLAGGHGFRHRDGLGASEKEKISMISNLTLLAAAAAVALAATAAPAKAAPAGIKNIVLVHGAWVDGSGWQGVYQVLKKDGYNVSIVQNPLSSLGDDVAATKRVLAMQDGPVILVGHSWGGAVITEAGNDPKVAGLVYVAAYVPDVGESANETSAPFGPTPGQQ